MLCTPIQAQVQSDSTLGTQVTQAGNTFNITGGTTAGTNLFHSFSEFSIPTGSIAHFQNADAIRNIFSRVTGLSPSQIDGVIQSNGTANLFLLNPNGILFGPNASLDVKGSFMATTADAIQFGEQGIFSATDLTNNPALLQTSPTVFQFNRAASQIAPISISSAVLVGENQVGDPIQGLRVPDGQNLVLLGGSIELPGGQLNAYGGRIEIGAVAQPGTVALNSDGSLSFPIGLTRADVTLSQRAVLDVRAGGGGSIAIYANNLRLLDSGIGAGIQESLGEIGSQAGDVKLDTSGGIEIQNSIIFNRLDSNGIGNAGNVVINANSLSLTNGAFIDSSTAGQGNGGSIHLHVQDAFSIDGSSAVFNNVETGAVGNAGTITIDAGSLSLKNNALINSSTDARGNGGDISIHVGDTLSIEGNTDGSNIASRVNPEAEGNAGTITIDAASLFLRNNAQISSSTLGRGNGGGLRIRVGDVFSIEGGSDGISGVFSEVNPREVDPGVVGNAGPLTVDAGSLFLRNSAQISSSTAGQGNGGDIHIHVRDAFSIEGGSDGISGVTSEVNFGGVGNAGIITIDAGKLSLENNAGISSSTSGRGNGGDLQIQVRDAFSVEGGLDVSRVFSQVNSEAEGNAGRVTITARSLSLRNNAQISSSTFGQGNGGNLFIHVGDTFSIEGGKDGLSGVASQSDPRVAGDAGSLTIEAGSLILKNFALIDASTSGQGNGGDLFIRVGDAFSIEGGSNGGSGVFS
jgi:filamentous hemagglutinin family protein